MIDTFASNNETPQVRPDSYWQSELNGSQWDAVRECDKPLLVIAGAGSGKTRVLTYKIAYLLEHGYEPWEVLALTFTNKAAREMNERISRIVGLGRSHGLWSGTFHSLFARILRQESEAVGMKRDFTIYDAADSRSLIKSIIKELGLDDKTYKASRIQGRISEAKNRLILPQEYSNTPAVLARDQRDNIGETHRIYTAYFQRCRTANAMDFDDLLLYTYLLFAHNEEIRLQYANRFRYILVDEYQDTNYAQHAIVSQLTRENHHICVVGDDAQSIYSFRGANIDNILLFHQQYPEAVIVKLEQNYRSTQNIVNAANSIILHNKGQIEKSVFSKNAEGDLISLMPAASDKEEAAKVVGTIGRLRRNEHLEFDEIAILYRTNAQSRSFEDAMRERNIPYRIYGGLSFYQRKEIKDIIAYFRLLCNLDDEEAFKRIVNYPARGIGNTTLQKLFSASREHSVSLWSVAMQPEFYGLKLNKGTLTKLNDFCSLILSFQEKAQTTVPFDLAIQVIAESGIKADLNREDGPEGESKRENVEELLGSIHAFQQETLEETGRKDIHINEFLQQSALQTDADQKEDGTPRVTLMTIHAAKGLEFDAVFVTGLEEGLFPGTQARFSPREMEEERRLFYVAVTRAKRFCHLSYAKTRYRYGIMEMPEESCFVREIDRRFIREDGFATPKQSGITPSLRQALFGTPQTESPIPSRPTRPTVSPATPFAKQVLPQTHKSQYNSGLQNTTASYTTNKTTTPTHSITINARVQHERFGEGIVIQLKGTGDNAKAIVEFANVGRKNLLLKFAKLKVLSS